MKKLFAFASIAVLMLGMTSCSKENDNIEKTSGDFVVGIAWRSDVDSEFLTNIQITLNDMGVKNVLLPEVVDSLLPYTNGRIKNECIDENDILKQYYANIVKSETYRHSNVTAAVEGVDAVIFTGGEDIAPTLYRTPEPWHQIEAEKDFNATRDVNDFLLMSYCLDKEIPLVGFCRGSQMLGVVSGATVIQDIPVWFQQQGLSYNFEHRNEKATPTSYRDYAPHSVNISEGSILATLFETTVVDGCPSWHHQAVNKTEETNLVVSGTTTVSGIKMVEGIERKDKKLAIGLQFHPEAAYVKHLNGAENAGMFMTREQVATFFRNFVTKAKALR